MDNRVVDGSLIVLGVLQIYSMFLPDVSSIPDTPKDTVRSEEFHASLAVGGLTVVACVITKSFFLAGVAAITAAAMIGTYEYAMIRANKADLGACGCEEY